jgi:hypothetical protein
LIDSSSSATLLIIRLSFNAIKKIFFTLSFPFSFPFSVLKIYFNVLLFNKINCFSPAAEL